MRTRDSILIALAAVAAATCGGPSEQIRISNATAEAFISVTVSGPSTMTPGATATFSAVGRTAAGTTADATSKVRWTTVDGNVLSITAAAQVASRAPGETQVVAALPSGVAGRLNVLVLPSGTFRLTGTVTDGGVALGSATVSVVSGIGSGSSATTVADGIYKLYGVAGDIQLQISAPGYTTSTQSLNVAASGVADFTIAPTNGTPNLTGTYAMTVTADSACAPPGSGPRTLPGDVRERHYIATMSQMGAKFQVTLGGADFVISNGRGNSFSGTVLAGRIQIRLNDGYYYGPYPDLFESLGNSRYISIDGAGTLTLTGADLSGTISGTYLLVNSPTNPATSNTEIGACYSQAGHPIALTRQTSTTRIRR